MQIERRGFLGAMAIGTVTGRMGRGATAALPASRLPGEWRREFPALAQAVNGHPLAYLDSAATTLRPRSVIDAIAHFSSVDNANPAASLHTLARRSADRYAAARRRVAAFLNASGPTEVVFTKGTTEAINLVAATWGSAHIREGDEIVLTVAEHYSNLLPWRALAERAGARVTSVDVDDEGRLLPERVAVALTPRTRLLSVSHVSNVLGLVNPVQDVCAIARRRGVAVLVDAAQSAPHLPIDVQAIGCDFLACSAHKLLGPMGVGILWAREGVLDGMPPYQFGSNMAHAVGDRTAQFEHGALKFQAGTPDVAGAVGLATAIDVLERISLAAIREHDTTLVRHFRERAARVPGLRVLGTLEDPHNRIPLFSFRLKDIPAAHIVRALDERGVAVRAGDMAALPLLARYGITEAVRASASLYTTTGEIDRLVDGLLDLAR